MLDELSKLQEDTDERCWLTSLSFSVETRENNGEDLVHRTYTFTWGQEFDEWHFSEYEEKRCDADDIVGERDWNESRHVWWHEVGEPIDKEVPQTVSNKLAERLDVDEVNLSL